MSSNAASCFTILKINKKNTEKHRKKENIYVYIYCGIRNELGHTTRRIRDNVLCAVVRACVPAVLHSLQFFLLRLILSKISGITLCMCTSHIVAVFVPDKSFVCLLFANICSFCLELQIACKTSAVHSLLAFNLQAANRKVTHTHTHILPLCV